MLRPGHAVSIRFTRLAAVLATLTSAACGGGGSGAPSACTAGTATVTLGLGTDWKLLGPSDWGSLCTLQVKATGLGTGERLALVLLNSGGPDKSTVTVSLSGASAYASIGVPLLAAAAPAGDPASPLSAASDDTSLASRTALASGRQLVTELQRAALERLVASGAPAGVRPLMAVQAASTCTTLPPAPPIGTTTRSFCVDKLDGSGSERRQATLRWSSDSSAALFYVTDDDWPNFQAALAATPPGANRPNYLATLQDYFEGTNGGTESRNADLTKHILPSLRQVFGYESDVDGDCRVIFLLTNLAKYPAGTGVVGFFQPDDVLLPKDSSATCSGTGLNGADMLYLLDPFHFHSTLGYSYASILDAEIPGTMAHELQHDVIINARCIPSYGTAACAALGSRDLWMNEGLSMNAEDFAGFGLYGVTERQNVGHYLSCDSTSGTCAQSASLTHWPKDPQTGSLVGDPIGDYAGVHLFLRWYFDQIGSSGLPGAASCATRADCQAAFAHALIGASVDATQAVASASALSFEEGYARYATAALFSGYGTPFDPRPEWDFGAGATPTPPWAPLHTAVGVSPAFGYPAFWKLSATPLTKSQRVDGWQAFVTGLGTGTDATLTVTTAAGVQPRAVVVRFSGTPVRGGR